MLGHCNPKTYEIGALTKDFSLDYLRERIHMRPRVRYFQAVLRLRSELQNAIQIYMKQSEFTNVTTPMVTANDCEGGGECFTLNPVGFGDKSGTTFEKHYFGRPTYLTVSGQLHLEALACSMSRVYTLSPVFRAEKSMSPKHLSEFLMLEVEEAFTFSLDSLLNRVESMCKFLAFYLERHCAQDLKYLRTENDEYSFGEAISSGTYARVTYDEAVEVLRWMEPFKEAFGAESSEPVNLNAQMERALVELVGNRPLFVTHYPSKVKPFYMKTEEDKVSCCFCKQIPSLISFFSRRYALTCSCPSAVRLPEVVCAKTVCKSWRRILRRRWLTKVKPPRQVSTGTLTYDAMAVPLLVALVLALTDSFRRSQVWSTSKT